VGWHKYRGYEPSNHLSADNCPRSPDVARLASQSQPDLYRWPSYFDGRVLRLQWTHTVSPISSWRNLLPSLSVFKAPALLLLLCRRSHCYGSSFFGRPTILILPRLPDPPAAVTHGFDEDHFVNLSFSLHLRPAVQAPANANLAPLYYMLFLLNGMASPRGPIYQIPRRSIACSQASAFPTGPYSSWPELAPIPCGAAFPWWCKDDGSRNIRQIDRARPRRGGA